MDFNFSPEETMLRDNVLRFVTAEYSLPKRQELNSAGRDHWARMAELGWLGIGIAEEAGGYDPSIASVMVIAEVLGGGLALEPYTGIGVLTPQVILAAAGPDNAAPLLAPVIEGRALIALANDEYAARGRLAHISTTARREGGYYVLNGEKTAVIGGARATSFLIAARTSGEVGDASGISLFLADRDLPGLNTCNYKMIDQTPMADLSLDNVRVGEAALIGTAGQALPALEAGTDIATVAAAFSTVGAMSEALTQTAEYLRTRKQFGVTLSTFQTLRHRAADMLVELEQARSAAFRGLAGLYETDPRARARAVSAMKIVTARCSHFVCGQAIQLHGGMGVTDELRISHLFKHVAVTNALLGTPAYHLERLSTLL